MPSIWNNRKREQLELELIRLKDELKGLNEIWYGQLPHTSLGDGKVSVKVPSLHELSEMEDKREHLKIRISRCEEELSRLKKRKGWG